MKLYGHPLSTCTRKVLVTLAEKGHRAELITIDLLSGEQKQKEHLARHPFGMVPVLDDDGFILLESRAIVRYLDAQLTGPKLTPSGTRAAARMDQAISVDQSYVAPHISALVRENVIVPTKGGATNMSTVESAKASLTNALRVINGELAIHKYIAGDTFTLADISLMPYVAALPMLKASDILGEMPHISGWWERVSARPSWRSLPE